MNPEQDPEFKPSFLRRILIGEPKDANDPSIFHRISLYAFLAWVGFGSDGLSSSAYGPDEAFRELSHRGNFAFLAVFLVIATAATVFIISHAYKYVIDQFPSGGGGYVVASKLLGNGAGIVSGSALLVDYVLTITVSVASGGDAIFSLLPLSWHQAKLPLEIFILIVLITLNLRGVKESVTALAPIFLVFVITHAILILGGILTHITQFPVIASQVSDGINQTVSTQGWWVLLMVFFAAYSRGAGTYTGIEAVSNGMQVMHEPRVQTAKKTMTYLAFSLAFTAGGILLCYLLFAVQPTEGLTLNAVLINAFAAHWNIFGIPIGQTFVWITLLSESALLFVAAQTGFIGGPRIMANMAIDSWLPRRFSSLSDRLTTKDGVLLVGSAAILLMIVMRGNVSTLVIMYAINVFLTFSLTTLSMSVHAFRSRKVDACWRRHLSTQICAFILSVFILIMMILQKFKEGAWLTLLVTFLLVLLCTSIRAHYRTIAKKLKEIDEELTNLPWPNRGGGQPIREAPTAVLLVGSFGGLGIHSLYTIRRTFPGFFKNVIFVSVGVLDSGTFKGSLEIESLKKCVEDNLSKYVALAKGLGWNSDFRCSTSTDVVAALTRHCLDLAEEFPDVMVFAGKLLWKHESWYQRLLHNETALQVERRLQWKGLTMAVLPLRLTDGVEVSRPAVYH